MTAFARLIRHRIDTPARKARRYAAIAASMVHVGTLALVALVSTLAAWVCS